MLRWIVLSAALAVGGAAPAETVKLANGDEINGEVVARDADYVEIEHPQLGRLRLTLDQLDGDEPSPGLFGTGFLRGWSRSIDVGFSGAQGNSEQTSLTVGLDFANETEFERWLLRGRYFLSADEDGTTDNSATLDVRRDWLFPGHRWFAFTALRYQYDQFDAWKHRVTGTAGPGYVLYRSEAQLLESRLGPSFTREFGRRQNEKGEILFALDYSWRPAERHRLALSNELYSLFLPELGEFRNLSRGEWRIRLTQDPTLDLKIGVENEYDSDAARQDKENDLSYWVSMGLDF